MYIYTHTHTCVTPLMLQMVHQECSGAVYPEVEALTQLMQYKTSNAGCCKVRV